MTITPFEGAKTARVNGTSLAYRERGEGEPVVFVHGGISDLRTWDQQLPDIGRSYRAITYSRRYARPNDDIDPEEDDPWLPHADDLAAFLQAIDAAPAHVVGNSFGGGLSLLTAIRYPEVVRSLVLEEPLVFPLLGLSLPPRAMELLLLLVRRPRTALAMASFGSRTIGPVENAFRRGDDETAMQTFFRGAVGNESYERLSESRMQQARENASALRAGFLRAVDVPIEKEEVRSVRVPTLLMTGERSPAIALRLTDRLEEVLTNVARVSIPDASHLMHEENASAVNEAIVRFLEQHFDGVPAPLV